MKNRKRMFSFELPEDVIFYKGHMDKIKGEGGYGGGRWVQLGWGGGMERKGIEL